MKIQRGLALVQGLILCCFSAMIVYLIQTETIVLYLSPKVIWLSKVSAILLFFMAIAKLVPMHHNHSVAHNCCGHGHVCASDHHHSPKINRILPSAIFVIPLILGFGMQPRVLASTALSNSINSDGQVPYYVMHTPRSDKLSSEVQWSSASVKSVAKDTDLMQLYLNLDDHPEQVYNQHWRLTGFVYKDPSLAKNQFVISRFVITCCIVDATPIGIIAESSAAPNLKTDTWVEVDGLLQRRMIDGAHQIEAVQNFHETDEGVPYLVVTSCKIVATPKDPYLAPPMQ
ncbi:conserved membrane hypothetical protein [Candidatus Desulfosporosinus infrequens]|uniref:TIGR03943 family protein n=1 Tax=Candidatus Desulfosporosinus infrequens TaxID=2043169 RepID=A0A2U3LI12_9FIRM|nr:conserved membrane hypothetical protein [Candidatus Desulfosporosinus infrequens]